MRGFVALHLRRFLERPGRTALSVIGIAVGTALVVAALGVYGSFSGSARRVTALAGGADVELSAPGEAGFDAALLSRVRSVQGVEAAVPGIRSKAVVGGTHALMLGFDASGSNLRGELATQVEREIRGLVASGATLDGVVLVAPLARSAHVGRGADVAIAAAGEVHRARVVGVVHGGALEALNRGAVALAPLPVAQTLVAKSGRLDVIDVLAAKGTDRSGLERRLRAVAQGSAIVASPGLRAQQAVSVARNVQQPILTIALLALFVAGFLVFNTMTMAALERRRELATLRALGGRRRPLLTGFLGEALLLGLLGAGVGLGIGIPLARAVVDRLPSYFSATIGVRIGFVLPLSALLTAFVVGVGMTVVATAVPAIGAVRVPPVDAMRPQGVLETAGREEGVRWLLTIVGVCVWLGGIALMRRANGTLALSGILVVVAGVATTGFGLGSLLTRLAASLVGRLGANGRLAAASVAHSPRRVVATTLAATIAIGTAIAVSGTTQNLGSSLRAYLAPYRTDDLVLATSGTNDVPSEAVMPPSLRSRLAQVPGVRSVLGVEWVFTTIGTERVTVVGAEPGTAWPAIRNVGARAQKEALAGRGVVVNRQLADSLGLHVGSMLSLPTSVGARRTRVVAVHRSFVTIGGLLVTRGSDVQRWFHTGGYSIFEIRLRPGADHRAVARAIQGIAKQSAGVPTFLRTGAETASGIVHGFDQTLAIFRAMQWLMIAAAALVVLNTLAIAVVERRRELGILRAIGTSRRRLRRSVLAEAAVIGALAGGLGALLGIGEHVNTVTAISTVTGLPIRYQFSAVMLLVALGGAIAVAAAGALGPAWRAARVNVIEAIGYE